MAIVGFGFTKINAEKKNNVHSGNVEVNHSINITKVQKAALNINKRDDNVLKIEFNFSINYSNNIGNIAVSGEILYSDTKEIIEETLKEWEKNNRLSQIVNEHVLAFIYGKTIIKTLEFSDLLNLPTPIPLPKLTFGNPEQKK